MYIPTQHFSGVPTDILEEDNSSVCRAVPGTAGHLGLLANMNQMLADFLQFLQHPFFQKPPSSSSYNTLFPRSSTTPGREPLPNPRGRHVPLFVLGHSDSFKDGHLTLSGSMSMSSGRGSISLLGEVRWQETNQEWLQS